MPLKSTEIFWLDSPRSQQLDSYVNHGQAMPAVRGCFRGDQSSVCLLSNPRDTMDLVCKIIMNKSCDNGESASLLVRGVIEVLKGIATVSILFKASERADGTAMEINNSNQNPSTQLSPAYPS
jgi:hypothetical protein